MTNAGQDVALADSDRAALNAANDTIRDLMFRHAAGGVTLRETADAIYLAGVAAERERCARLCDLDLRRSKGRQWEEACIACAAAIRSQGKP